MPLTETQMLYAAVAGVVLLLVLLTASARRVPQGFEYTVERNGRFRRVLQPGLSFLLPGFERIGARQDLRERQLEVSVADVLSGDRIPLVVEATLFYQIDDAAKASYEVDDVDNSLRALATVTLRRLVGERDLDGVLADRGALGTALLAATDDAAAVWGVRLLRTELGRLQPPEALVTAAADARTQALRSRAEASAVQARTQAQREASESERDAVLAAAQAQADAVRIAAEADERVAEGEARAALMLSRALHEGDVRALNYLLARQYIDALGELARSDNGRFVVLPLENGGVAASLTGIRELAEETFAGLGGEGSAARATGAGDTTAASDAAQAELSAEAGEVADELTRLAEALEQDPPAAGAADDGGSAPMEDRDTQPASAANAAQDGPITAPAAIAPFGAAVPDAEGRAGGERSDRGGVELAPDAAAPGQAEPAKPSRSGGFWGRR